jgi:AcrR family transcriptional regulator
MRPARRAPEPAGRRWEALAMTDGAELADGSDVAAGPRAQRRRRRIALGREQILDTAERLFGEQGYRSTSLQQVAEACEYSVGSLYQFFRGKQELLEAVLGRRGGELLGAMRQAAAVPGPALEALAGLLRVLLRYYADHPSFAQLSVRMFAPLSEVAVEGEPFHRNLAVAYEIYAGVLRRGQEEGVIRAGSPLTLARLLSALVSTHHVPDSDMTDDEFVAFAVHAFTPPTT